jgi:hypothetical protein
MKKYLIENNRIIEEVILGKIEDVSGYQYEDGWRDAIKPEINPLLQVYGEMYFDEIADAVTFEVIDKAIDITAEIQRHYRVVEDTIREISGIISVVKNIYDPLRDAPENIPADFKTLVRQVQSLRQRAYDEIEALTTPEEVLNYVVRGPEVDGYINQLESYI